MVEQPGCIRINLLGKPIVQLNEMPLNIKRKKCRALIFYLAAHTNPVCRDKIQDVFWPDHNLPTAQHNLNVHLYEIRKQVPRMIISDDSYLQIAPGVQIDTRLVDLCFVRDHDDEQKLHTTIALYRGDFLEGFTIADSPEFDSWKSEQQEHYLTLFIRGLAKSAEFYCNRGEYEKGLAQLQQAIRIDPLQEELYRSMMLNLYHAGDILKVAQTYKKLKRVLAEELGISPMPETKALYEAIVNNKSLAELGYSNRNKRRNDPKKISLSVKEAHQAVPFVGREQEMKKLQDLSGKKGLVIVEGTPGIGKTRLVEEYALQWDGFVLYGKSFELENDIPYHPIIEAMEKLVCSMEWKTVEGHLKNEMNTTWWNEMRCLVPGIDSQDKSQPPASGDKDRLRMAFAEFITVLSRKQKVLFLIDDLQWADQATVNFVAYLVRKCADENIYFLGTHRCVYTNPAFVRSKEVLRRLNLFHDFTLTRLGKESVRVLAKQIRNEDNATLVEWLERMTMGNAFQLTAFVCDLKEKMEDPSRETVDIQNLIDVSFIPQTIEGYISSRIAVLSEKAKRILEVASVYGNQFDFKVLAKVADLPETDALEGLEELLLQNNYFVAKDNQKYVFHHKLLREVIYRLISPCRREWIHLHIALTLENNPFLLKGEKEFLLAYHFKKSSQPERAAPYVLKAGNKEAPEAGWKEATVF